MKSITAYQTSDGAIWPIKSQAEKHDVFLKSREVFEEFLDSKDNAYTATVQRAIARNSIISWETWKTKNEKRT
jgi:hypothetical protein